MQTPRNHRSWYPHIHFLSRLYPLDRCLLLLPTSTTATLGQAYCISCLNQSNALLNRLPKFLSQHSSRSDFYKKWPDHISPLLKVFQFASHHTYNKFHLALPCKSQHDLLPDHLSYHVLPASLQSQTSIGFLSALQTHWASFPLNIFLLPSLRNLHTCSSSPGMIWP